jgi:hypothetical protein
LLFALLVSRIKRKKCLQTHGKSGQKVVKKSGGGQEGGQKNPELIKKLRKRPETHEKVSGKNLAIIYKVRNGCIS